jgi:hypothetical protein
MMSVKNFLFTTPAMAASLALLCHHPKDPIKPPSTVNKGDNQVMQDLDCMVEKQAPSILICQAFQSLQQQSKWSQSM